MNLLPPVPAFVDGVLGQASLERLFTWSFLFDLAVGLRDPSGGAGVAGGVGGGDHAVFWHSQLNRNETFPSSPLLPLREGMGVRAVARSV